MPSRRTSNTRRPTRAARPSVAKVSVGYFGSELHTVVMNGTESVNSAFDKAGITLEDGHEILTISGDKVESTEVVKNGETYYLAKKYKSE